MPIFQEYLDHDKALSNDYTPAVTVDTASLGPRRFSQESLPIEFCEGPIPDSPEKCSQTPKNQNDSHPVDRSVLIERLKRRESPPWIADQHHNGLEIERPRSALHSGDFTHDGNVSCQRLNESSRHHQDGSTVDMAWMSTSPPRTRTSMPSFQIDQENHLADPISCSKFANTTLSSSLSSTFTYQPPTSPLARSVTNRDDDSSPVPFRESGFLSDKLGKTRTIFDEFSPFPLPLGSNRGAGLSSRRETTFAYQAHQPRRSLSSGMGFLQTGHFQNSTSRSRRPSLGSDPATSLHASMVGCYEESILQGRMSTTPSKPFDFLAQIGVLGKGKCKSCLRCPAHVTLPFSAVFYSYSNTSTARSQSNDGPSPYVGQIDLENGLFDQDARESFKWKMRRSQSATQDMDVDMLLDGPLPHDDSQPSAPLKAPPGGSYRIPQKGQIQIVVKNQNKTAVKLFLVPYDLKGMPPGTKTFIRQRSYSHGPIIDNLPNQSASASAVAMGRPTLRYLVHLHICSPCKGRFYLYRSVRIVFANRVPEGKEKLRNETTLPEPRFTPYKPIRQMQPAASSTYLSSRGGLSLVADKAFRRRSLGVPAPSSESHRSPFSAMVMGALDDDQPQQQKRRYLGPRVSGFSTGGVMGGGNTQPIDAIPYRFPGRNEDCTDGMVDDEDGPPTGNSSQSGSWGSPQYEKLSRGDAGYGGNIVSDAASQKTGALGGAEGLLSRRLRDLGADTKDCPFSFSS